MIEIGQILVPRALNDTKKIRKAGADIFANFGLEKPWNNLDNSNISPDFANLFDGFSPKRAESTYKRLGPKWS